MHHSLQQLRALVEHEGIRVVVSDLDGVLRVFDQSLWGELDQLAGTPEGTVLEAVLGNPYLDEVVRGRGTHAQWQELAVEQLREAGAEAGTARTAVEHWARTPATVDREVLEMLSGLRARGTAVFVLTNGTDRVPEELAELGLDSFLGEERRFLLNTADLGAAKPEPEAFRRAHGRIQQVLETRLPPERIVLLDDSGTHVRGAEAAGWRGLLHPTG